MALEANKVMPTVNVLSEDVSKPVQIHSFWAKVHDNSKVADDSTLNDPEDNITANARLLFCPLGTSLVLCHGYTGSVNSVSTQPVVKVFGRTVSDASETTLTALDGVRGQWMVLPNKAGSIDITISDSATDTTDGTTTLTTVDPDAHVVDLMGCNQILVGIKTASAGSTTGFILGKMI
tara:strand:- start:2625 stop:3158 length:534 start_codon:yes stop_codon:yes gene_type:complete